MKNELYRLCEYELDEILKILVIKHPKTHDELEDYSIIVKEIVETYEAKRKNLSMMIGKNNKVLDESEGI